MASEEAKPGIVADGVIHPVHGTVIKTPGEFSVGEHCDDDNDRSWACHIVTGAIGGIYHVTLVWWEGGKFSRRRSIGAPGESVRECMVTAPEWLTECWRLRREADECHLGEHPREICDV